MDIGKVRRLTSLPGLLADVLADQVSEAAFGAFAESVVVRGFLADHEASAVIAGVEPFRAGSGGAIRTVEANAGAHFYKGSALKIGWGFVLDAHERSPLIVLQDVNGAD